MQNSKKTNLRLNRNNAEEIKSFSPRALHYVERFEREQVKDYCFGLVPVLAHTMQLNDCKLSRFLPE